LKRASLIFLDEAAFSTDELIAVAEAFALQDADFATSTDVNFNLATQPRQCPTQIIYASSQSEMDKTFYKHYKNYAKEMFAGNTQYFVCDMICDTAINTYMSGEKYAPLITQEKVNAALKANRELALREYYNRPTKDGGENQIIKWATIRRNETFSLPEVTRVKNGKYVISFDPARTNDQSVLTVMKICFDNDVGYYGELVNCINMIDTASKKKLKLDSNRQKEIIRESLLSYNGRAPDYENIEMLYIDAGAGGGGVSTYSDGLLDEWIDSSGAVHKGLLDPTYEIYDGYETTYPNNATNIRLINPRKYKKQMTEELIELMSLDLIKFPREYGRSGYISLSRMLDNGEEESYEHSLSWEEESALVNIDVLKAEVTSIYRYKNSENTTVTYALPQDKINKMNDDRFYTLIMLAHHLYGLRRNNLLGSSKENYEYKTFVN